MRVAETRLRNADNQYYGTRCGNDTTDRIFLLSLEEVVQYFGDSGELRNRPSLEANNFGYEDSSVRVALDLNGNTSVWWLRSPGVYNTHAAYVSNDGRIFVSGSPVHGIMSGEFIGFSGHIVDHGRGGVRPALWLNL